MEEFAFISKAGCFLFIPASLSVFLCRHLDVKHKVQEAGLYWLLGFASSWPSWFYLVFIAH